MDTPICHRLMGTPVVYSDGGSFNTIPLAQNDASGCLCLGSRCALWTPEMTTPKGNRPSGTSIRVTGCRDAIVLEDDNGRTSACSAEPTGRGWCADNMRRAPFADPAVRA